MTSEEYNKIEAERRKESRRNRELAHVFSSRYHRLLTEDDVAEMKRLHHKAVEEIFK